jgi:hypothetical protein
MSDTTFDLSSLEHQQTAEVQLTNPTNGDDIPGAIATVYGQDSDKFRNETRKAETKYTDYSRRNRGKFMPAEMREALDRTKIVACVKSITGLSYHGEPITDIEDIFTKFPWIQEQISQGIVDRANFIKGSSTK